MPASDADEPDSALSEDMKFFFLIERLECEYFHKLISASKTKQQQQQQQSKQNKTKTEKGGSAFRLG